MSEFISTHPYVVPIAIVVFLLVVFFLIGYKKVSSTLQLPCPSIMRG